MSTKGTLPNFFLIGVIMMLSPGPLPLPLSVLSVMAKELIVIHVPGHEDSGRYACRIF